MNGYVNGNNNEKNGNIETVNGIIPAPWMNRKKPI